MEDRWIGIYQLMETWLSFITALLTGFSLLFVWKGYLLAKDYLKQHSEKAKEENRQKIIIDCIQRAYKLKANMLQYYGIPDISHFDDTNIREVEAIISWFLRYHGKRSNLFHIVDGTLHELIALVKILDNEELTNSVNRIGKIVSKLQSMYYEMSDLANENDFRKAYEIILELKDYGSTKKRENVLQLGFKSIELLSIDLVSLYHRGKIIN